MEAVFPEGPASLPLVAGREVDADDDPGFAHAHADDLPGQLGERQKTVPETGIRVVS